MDIAICSYRDVKPPLGEPIVVSPVFCNGEPIVVSSLFLVDQKQDHHDRSADGEQEHSAGEEKDANQDKENEYIADLVWTRMQRITNQEDYGRHPKSHMVYSWLATIRQQTHVIATWVQKTGEEHVLVAFVEEYRTDGGPCWGSMANEWLTKQGIHIGGKFYHAFWDEV